MEATADHGMSSGNGASLPRRMLWVIGLTFAVGCALVGGLNYLCNPLSYYAPRIFEPLVESSRGLKTEQMRSLRWNPSTVILGSSRGTLMPPAEISKYTGRTAYNAGADGSRVEDYLALYRYGVEACHWKVDEVVVAVDFDAFHEDGKPHVELVTATELFPYVDPRRTPDRLLTLRSLLAWDQTAQTIAQLRYVMHGYPKKNRVFDELGWERHPVSDPLDDAQRETRTFQPRPKPDLDAWVDKFRNWRRFDPVRLELFEELVRLAKGRGTRVRAFLTPLHHLILARLRESENFGNLHATLNEFMMGLAQRYPNFSFLDFTNVQSFGGNADNFYEDGNHLQRENYALLVRALYETQGRR